MFGCDKHLKLLDRAVSGARFLTGGVVECDISHRRSVAVLCMLYKIKRNQVQPLNDALPGPYVPVRVTRGALVTHQYTYAPPRCRTSQYSRTFIHLSVSLWNDLLTPYSMVWDWRVSKAGPTFLYRPKLIYPYYSTPLVFLALLSVYRLVLWGWGLRTDRVYITLSQPCTANLF